MTKTYFPKSAEIEREWYVVDAAGHHLGRLASIVASTLRGKHKPIFVPYMDTGDFVIVVNADKAILTGRKEEQKVYYRHSGRPGGMKERSVKEMRAHDPAMIVEIAVKGMLPKNSLGRQQYRKLKVYAGPDHPHQAQQPKALDMAAAEL
jgi:large subunit ribosomal protein L13